MTMFKAAAVSYPKRRKKKDEFVINEIQEPVRKTMYDVTKENFEAVNRVTFMHRVIYAGEHFYQKDESELEKLFRKIVDKVNESYTPAGLTGFLLCYTKYFIHLVEGDEDSINKHLLFLQHCPDRHKKLGVIKLVIHVSHISRRIMREWTTYYGIPAQYLGKINIDSDLEESARHVYNCIRKMYSLVFSYSEEVDVRVEETQNVTQPTLPIQPVPEEEPPSAMDLSTTRSVRIKTEMKFSTVNMSTSKAGSQFMGTTPMDPYRNSLPEYEIVDFVIKTNFTEDITKYTATYGMVPQRLIYKDQVWPCHQHYIPYDVFSKPYDTITELPKTGKTEDKGNAENNVEGGTVEESPPK